MNKTDIYKKRESVSLWFDISVFITACWIALAFFYSLFKSRWFLPGDFSYPGAMFYHAVMIPALILLYLMVIRFFPLKRGPYRLFAGTSVLAVLLAGTGSAFNMHSGFTYITVIQVSGMFLTDLLGIVLIVIMLVYACREHTSGRKMSVAYWMLWLSILVVLLAAPFGHLAGWSIDLGTRSLPGKDFLMHYAQRGPDEMQEGLITSHSHMIVVAFLFALSATVSLFFQYQHLKKANKRICNTGLWIMGFSLVSATVIYILHIFTGREPPVLFSSGPNGVPLDDAVLTLGEVGILFLMAGLWTRQIPGETIPNDPVLRRIRYTVFLIWFYGFIGAVLTGLYIEFHETFYGAGLPPAPGAVFDNVFIRAHLLYPFLFLPVMLTFLLAAQRRYEKYRNRLLVTNLFIWISVIAITLGLAGEWMWLVTLNNILFISGYITGGTALLIGVIMLWPGRMITDRKQGIILQ